MSETGGSSFRPGALRPPVERQPMEQKLRDAAGAYEKMFLREMVKAMRSTVSESGLIKQNPMEKMFREELDSENVSSWGAKGGVGLADMIYQNLVDRFGPQLGIANQKPLTKMQGPIALDALRDSAKANAVKRLSPPSPQMNEVLYEFALDGKSDSSVSAPWGGILLDAKSLGDGLQYAEISHDNGLTGRMTWRGSLDRLKIGQSVEAGENVGLLSPEAKNFFWSLRENSQNSGPSSE